MKGYVIAFIVCGSVAAAFIVLGCLCNARKKNKNKRPTIAPSITTPPPRPSYYDVETGQKSKSSATKDGGMMILGAGAAVAATAATVAVVSTSAGGGYGDSGGGCGGGGCGGGGGGCGGGCGCG